MKENEALVVLEPVGNVLEKVDTKSIIEKWTGKIGELDPELGMKDSAYLEYKNGKRSCITARNQIDRNKKHIKAPAILFNKEAENIARMAKESIANIEDQLFIQCHRVESFEADKKQKLLDDEKIRVDTISASISNLMGVPSACIGLNAKELIEAYERVDLPDEDIYQERTDEALHHYKEIMHTLEGMIDQAKKAEAADEIIKAEQERAAKVEKEAEAERAKQLEELAAEKQALAAEKAEWNRKKNAEEEQRRKDKAEEYAERVERDQAEAAEKLQREQEEESKRVEEEKRIEAKVTAATIKKIKKKAIAELTDILISYAQDTKIEIAVAIFERIAVGNVSGIKWAYDE